jgi:hypothetical protein
MPRHQGLQGVEQGLPRRLEESIRADLGGQQDNEYDERDPAAKAVGQGPDSPGEIGDRRGQTSSANPS